MAKTINRRLAELIDGSGQLQTGKLPNAFITTAHYSSNSITDAKLHTSFSLPASALTARDTGDLSEGSNLYYTTARWDSKLAAADTGDLSEGSNLYYTDARVGTYISGDRSYGNITTTGYIAGPASMVIDPAGVGDNTGTVVIAGNLQVDGTTTTINSTTMTVDDLNLTLASGAANAAAANGAGITVDGASATITYDGTNDEWDFNKPTHVEVAGSRIAEFGRTGAGTYDLTISDIGEGAAQLWFQAQTNDNGFVFRPKDSSGNSTNALYIAPDGDVGIGTTSPITKLTVKNDSASTSFGDNNIITIQNANTTDNSRMGLAFTGNTNIGSGLAIIEGVSYDQSVGHTSLNFSVYNGSWHNDMMVLKAGNVGIGTTNPTNPLSISVQEHGLYSQHRPSNSNGVGQEMYYKFNTADGTPEIFSSIYSEIESNANGAESGKIALRAAKAGNLTTGLILIGSTGNVGIGTTSPSVNLEVIDPVLNNFNGAITVGGNGSGRRLILEQTDVLTYRMGGTGTNSITQLVSAGSAGTGTVAMTIDESQNVGIGTNDPTSKLEVIVTQSDTMTDATAAFAIKGNGGDGILMGQRATTPYAAWIAAGYLPNIGTSHNYPLTLQPHGGNVGIGTTSPETALHITGATGGGIKIKQAGQIAYTPSSADNFNQGITFYNAGSSHAFGIGYGQGGVLKYSYHDNAGTYTEIAKMGSDGELDVTGALVANSFRPNVNNRWKMRNNSADSELVFEYATSSVLSDNNIKVKFVANGNVLLRTNSDKVTPTANLDVASDVGVSLQLSSQYNYGPNRNWAFRTNNYGSSNWGGWSLEQSGEQQGTPDIPRIGVHANGYVGINMGGSASSGLTSINPATALHVGGDITVGSADTVGTGGAAAIRFQNDNERSRISSIYASGGGGELSFYTDSTGGTLLKRMHLSNSGELRFFGPSNLQVGGITSEGNDSLVISGNSANSAGIHMHPSQNCVVPAEGSGRAPADTKDLGRAANSWRNIYLGTGIVQSDDTHTLQHDGGTDRGYKFNLGFIRGGGGNYNHIKTSLPSNTNVMMKFEYDGWIYSGTNMHESVTFYTYHAQSTPHGPTYVDYGSGGGIANVYYSSDNYVVIVIQAHGSYTGGFLYAQCGRSHYATDIQILATGSNSTTSGVF